MEQIMEVISYAGSILLAICALPMAWQCYRDGHSRGINGLALTAWFLGEILTLIYVLYLQDKALRALMLNYGLNFIFLCVIVKYKLKPRVAECQKNG